MTQWNKKTLISVGAVTLATMATVIVVIASSATSQIQIAGADPQLLVYSVKYECREYPDDPMFANDYAIETKINVHNPNLLAVNVNTKLLELDVVPTHPQNTFGPIISQPWTIDRDWGWNLDCEEITAREAKCLGFVPPTQEGFVIIETFLPLDVVVLYKMDGEPIIGSGQGVDLEYERVLPTPAPALSFSPPTFPPCDWF